MNRSMSSGSVSHFGATRAYGQAPTFHDKNVNEKTLMPRTKDSLSNQQQKFPFGLSESFIQIFFH